MRKIKFKIAGESDFSTFIDIGSCEKHYDFLPLFNSKEELFTQWQESFAGLEMGVQMLTLHYYLQELTENNYVPKEIHAILSNDLSVLNEFNAKWFEPEAPFFKGLDLNWEDVNDEVEEADYDENDVMTFARFKNGDEMRFLEEDDDTIASFYVTEEQFPALQLELNKVCSIITSRNL
jgi:hypothetical protein